MFFIDSHTHLYVQNFESDVNAVISRALENGVHEFYFPAIDSSTHEAMILLESQFPNQCFSMMGLHPCSVNEVYDTELEIVKGWLQKRKFVAIGEIGLDFYWEKTFIKQQIDAFEQQMQLALDYNLPINIHTRNAMQETIDMVKPFSKKGLKGIFHCFGGSYESAKQILDLEFSLGIGGVVTYPKAGLGEVLQKISLEHIVLETDAPYLTPVPHRGKRNESGFIKIIAQKIADIKGESIDEVAWVTSQNAKKIYGT